MKLCSASARSKRLMVSAYGSPMMKRARDSMARNELSLPSRRDGRGVCQGSSGCSEEAEWLNWCGSRRNGCVGAAD